ncbi:hypothetical protein J4E90_010044 [Alternaria incomplexa]|uniref:uncharacterized protein n=1 Tax=Alternaria incomplexa TaxID=1187928 RepID=UPI002220508D|nr:uncharacterized protein J4E90_010044 [Alternaria incomplexa]KAI4906841.1 hypothetical protein J4E90_010044 [Alternaria incomplexa]
MAPSIHFTLYTSAFCYIDCSDTFDISLVRNVDYHSKLTIDTKHTIFDPEAAFAKGLFELVDAETGESVDYVPSKTATQDIDRRLLILDPKKLDSYIMWSTRPGTTVSNPMPYTFDPSSLVAGKSYTIRLRSHGITTWYAGGHNDPNSLPEPETESIPQPSSPLPSYTFKALATVPKPPPIRPTILTSTDTISVSGNPPCTITLAWRLDTSRSEIANTKGIAVLRSIPHGRNKASVELRDLKTGKKRGPMKGYSPPDADVEGETDPFPPNETEVLVFENSETVHERSYTLISDPDEAGIWGSDTRLLKVGEEHGRYGVGVLKGDWAWVSREEVGEEVWGDQERLRGELGKVPMRKWRTDEVKVVGIVE